MQRQDRALPGFGTLLKSGVQGGQPVNFDSASLELKALSQNQAKSMHRYPTVTDFGSFGCLLKACEPGNAGRAGPARVNLPVSAV